MDDNSKTKQRNSDEELKTNLTKHHRLLQPTEIDYKRLENQVISSSTDERIAIYTMVGRWYRYYQDDPWKLAIIRLFAKQYQPVDAVHWFTKATFIYQFINRLLRSGNTELSHNMRSYIADLSTQLAKLKYEQKELMKGIKILYRGLRQSEQELEALKKLVGGSILINSFMSTSWNIEVAVFFAGIDQPPSAESRPLLLKLTIDFDLSSVVAADVSSLSDFPQEREVLFDIATEFRVETLVFDYLHKIWICQLSALSTEFLTTKSSTILSTETNIFTNKPSFADETICYDYRRKSTHTTTRLEENELWLTRQTLPWFANTLVDVSRIRKQISFRSWQQIGFRSWQQGDIRQAKIYLESARKLYEQEAVDQNERARLYASLGFILYKSGEYSRAIQLAERSLAMTLRIEPANHLILARYYRILGLAYGAGGRIKDALACHDQALIIDENLRCTERWSMVLTLRNFALIHRDRGDSASAAEYFRRTWRVFQEVSANLLESHQ